MAGSGGSRPSICIVSNEIIGPSKNGGIGTAMTGLAIALAEAGFPVTILFTDGVTVAEKVLAAAARHYGALGIDFQALRPHDLRPFAGDVASVGFALPAAVFEWLSSRQFDVVHFNDTHGHGHLCLAAKRLALAFHQTRLVVAVHSPHRWINALNGSVPETLLSLCFEQAERASIAAADTTWCPSRYLLAWLRTDGFRLPSDTLVQQYVMPPDGRGGEQISDNPQNVVAQDEIVFFGRLEERKGLRIFCDAIEQLDVELATRGTVVTFLGRSVIIDGMSSEQWIAQRSANWRTRPKLLADLGQPEAIAYLKGRGRVAVMASPADNSPCTVYEAINFRIPFLAAATGGIPELVHADDQSRVLFDYEAPELTARLRAALDTPRAEVRPAISDIDNRARWIALHESWSVGKSNPAASEVTAVECHKPTIAVIVRCGVSGGGLNDSIRSLAPAADRIIDRMLIGTGARTATIAGHRTDWKIASGPTAADELHRFVAETGADIVLVLEAGATVDAASLLRHANGLASSGFDGVLAAARNGKGKLVAGLGGGAMLAFHQGLLATGAAVFLAAALKKGAARGLASREPVHELLDQSLLAGAELIASPVPMLGFAAAAPKPPITPERVELYAKQAGSQAIAGLLAVAARAERDGGLPALARRLGNRVVASPAGFLAPRLAQLWRSRGRMLLRR